MSDNGSKVEFLLSAINQGLGEDIKIEYGDEMCMLNMAFPDDQCILTDINLWIGNLAASVHLTPHKEGMTDICKAEKGDGATMGNGKNESITTIGDVPGIICDKSSKELGSGLIQNVSYLLKGKFNLFSLSYMIENREWNLGGNKNQGIWITKGDQKINFDIKISTKQGAIYCMYFKHKNEVGVAATKTKMNIVKIHGLLGHGHEASNRRTAKALEIDITRGTLPPCEACVAAKAEQKAIVANVDYVPAIISNEWIYTDIATLYRKLPDGNKKKISNGVWSIKVDEKTGLKFLDFTETKDAMVEPTLEKFNKWKQAGMPVENVRLDNAGENKKMKARSESADWKMNINWEFTARNTPQQNHLAELGFTTLAKGARAMMHAANVPPDIRYKLIKEAVKAKTLVDGLAAVTINGVTKTRYEHWCGKNPAFAKHLRTWGEAGTVTL